MIRSAEALLVGPSHLSALLSACRRQACRRAVWLAWLVWGVRVAFVTGLLPRLLLGSPRL